MLHVNLPVASWRWKNYLDYPDSILLLSIGYQSLSWDVVLVPALQVCIVGVCFIPFRKIEVMWGSLSFVNILVQRCMIYVKNEWMNRMFISRIFLKNTPFFSAWCLAKTKKFFLSWLVPISYHWVVMLSGLEIRKNSIPYLRLGDPFVPLREHGEVECLRSSMLCFLTWTMASSALAGAGLSLLRSKAGDFRHQDLVNSKTDITQSWQLLTFSFASKNI